MRNKFFIFLCGIAAILIAGVILATIYDPSGIAVLIISTSSTIIGAVAIFFQYRSEKEIEQFNFAIQFFESFNKKEEIFPVKELLDAQYGSGNVRIAAEYTKNVLVYLAWIKSFSILLARGVLNYNIVDVAFAYKFFAFVNNRDIQEMELLKYPRLYRVIFEAYDGWLKYLKSIGKKQLFESTALSDTDVFKAYMRKGGKQK